ncbi:MAG: hypothetical protein QW091_02535 [Candidatus Micrarchaeaceae archaeon]
MCVIGKLGELPCPCGQASSTSATFELLASTAMLASLVALPLSHILLFFSALTILFTLIFNISIIKTINTFARFHPLAKSRDFPLAELKQSASAASTEIWKTYAKERIFQEGNEEQAVRHAKARRICALG